ncbi:PLP-dependent aminotransferase family protein [Microbacterium karelineae]|uniref:aminotransferase-like domain-containing protein n=1 Tax=Microbacterium karelineae TaxID=2654283 RepID=UPI0012EAC838|nr:aminotransferase class I/II-fold pyridoxal phosphate-dependent enzyme [Microbacterium karelineae]
MTPLATAGVLAQRVDTPTPTGIATTLAALIAEGSLAPGDRLPTVRDFARALGVSPATVSTAWQALAGAGSIVARGRAGTFIRQTETDAVTPHTRRLAGHVGPARLDLSRGTPDPALLPDLARAFARATPRAGTASYHDSPVLPALERQLREGWPAPSHRLTVLDGALDAIDRSLQQLTRFGDRVIVEEPTFPPFHDLLEALHLVAVPVVMDEHGMLPDALADALARGPRAAILQPRAQNPTGASMTAARAEELADVLRRSPRGSAVTIIEDDHSDAIAQAAAVSLSASLPEQTIVVRSFSKSHGPDLRIAALGGPDAVVERIEARRTLGAWWTPRLIQRIVAELLVDGEAIADLAFARATYAARQRRFAAALSAELGGDAPAFDGINSWIPVADERAAIVSLAAQGIRAAAGSAFTLSDATDRIRVTIGALASDPAPVAAAVARAARAQ